MNLEISVLFFYATAISSFRSLVAAPFLVQTNWYSQAWLYPDASSDASLFELSALSIGDVVPDIGYYRAAFRLHSHDVPPIFIRPNHELTQHSQQSTRLHSKSLKRFHHLFSPHTLDEMRPIFERLERRMSPTAKQKNQEQHKGEGDNQQLQKQRSQHRKFEGQQQIQQGSDGDEEGWIEIDQDESLTFSLLPNGEIATLERLQDLLQRAYKEGCILVVQEIQRTPMGRILYKKVVENEKLIHVGLAAFANAGDLCITILGQKSYLEKTFAGIRCLSSLCKVRFHWKNSAQKASKSKTKQTA